MYIEIKIALNFLLSYLYDKLPRRRVNLFGEELEKYLAQKLTLANWGSGSHQNSNNNSTSTLNELHCINLNRQELFVEPCLVSASAESALDLKEILAQLPDYLKLFIEPGLVAYVLEPPPVVPGDASPPLTANQLDLKILYKLPQIDVASLTYVNSSGFSSAAFLKDSAFSGDGSSSESILNENLLQLLNASAAANNVRSPSSSSGASSSSPTASSQSAASPLHYFMQKMNLNDEQTANQVMANLGQLSKHQHSSKPAGSAFHFKPNLSSTEPILQSELALTNRNAISPTANVDLWSSSSSSSCSSSSSSTGGSSSCLPMLQPGSSLASTASASSLLLAVSPSQTPSAAIMLNESSGKNAKQAASTAASNGVPVKAPNSLFTTAEFAQTKFGSTKSKNSYYSSTNKSSNGGGGGGNKTSAAAVGHHNQPVSQQPLLSPQQGVPSLGLPHHHYQHHGGHHQQQKMNPEFSAYIKQKAAAQQLLKTTPGTPTSPPVLGSTHSSSSLLLNQNGGFLKSPPPPPQNHQPDPFLEISLALNQVNPQPAAASSLIYDMENGGSQQQQQQLNLLLMNLLKVNNAQFGFSTGDLLGSSLFAPPPSMSITSTFNDLNSGAQNGHHHHQSFDSIVNSTIKEMIDGDFDELDEPELLDKGRFDENNNDLASAVADASR